MKDIARVFSILLLLDACQAEGIVVPNQFATTGGDTSSIYPFGFAANPPSSMRYQQVYAGSQFSAISQGGGLVTALAFRFAGGTGLGVNFPDMQIDLSTTS